MKTTDLRIERRSFDGELVAYWEAALLRRRSAFLVWHTAPQTPIIYPRRGFSTRTEHHEIGWIWPQRRYMVSVELDERGDLSQAVCRIALPPTIVGRIVSLRELGLLMRVEPGPLVQVDDDEFQEAANDYGYDPELRASAWSALEEVRKLLEAGEGPFGPDLTKMHALALRRTAERPIHS
jgi:protein associated with RNAse G/E